MDAYQRGNRDGLISLSIWAEEQARIYKADYEKKSELVNLNSLTGLRYEMTVSRSLVISTAYKDIAAHAKKMAEALPIDPESETLI